MKITNKINCLIISAVGAGMLSAQTEPKAGSWRTWVISSGQELRIAGPSNNSEATEIGWVKSFMSQANANSLAQVSYWDAGPPSYRWIQMAFQEVTKHNLAPTLSTRAMSLVSVAMYDATVAAWDNKYTYNRRRPSELDPSIVPRVAVPLSPSFPSEHAVTAAAASAVLEYLFPDSAATFKSLAEEDARSRLFAGTQYPSDLTAGMELGARVGAAVVAYAKADGSDAQFTGSFPVTPGVWSNTNPVTPLAGSWRPWIAPSGDELRLSPPPAFGSAEANAQYMDVKNQTRTNATNHSAWFWQPSFIAPWLDSLNREIFEHRWDTNPPRAAHAYALETIAQHDATIGCWANKYAYLELRPSMADSSIVPLFANPGHPGFPSGHACASAGAAAVLGYLFPPDSDTFVAQASDAGLSTFYANIHTHFDVDGGLTLGQTVGRKVVQRATEDGAQ